MAVTSQQIIDFLLANPGMSDADIAAAMQTYNVTPAQMAQAVGLPVEEVQTRYKEAAPSVYTAENVNKLADQILSQGTTEAWTGGLPPEKAALYMADELAKSGVTDITQVAKGDDGIINVMTGDKLVSGYGERTKDNLWSGSYEGKGNTAFGVNFDESGKPVFYTQGASSSTLKDDILKVAAVGALAFGIPGVTEGLLTGSGLGAGASLGTGLTAGAGGLGLSTGGAGLGAAGTGAGLTAGAGLAGTNALTGAGLGTALGGVTTGVGAAGAAAGTGLLTSAGTKVAENLVGKAVGAGLTTAGGLVQSQVSKEAAQAAQKKIDEETAAAKSAAAFRPVGMTTRFGSSQFAFDPKTGQLTSAGYTLSPEAKAAQDRFVKLAEAGITQAEGAQKAFEPLQTGAQSLFTLGNKYLAQSPEQVASDYLKSQMALLQPGRELELANLQNKLQQQGRAGLSVAQGGSLGATTPELQALFNARAQQEAILAANAQREGQQNVLFGSGLLNTGAQTLGQYYGGQSAAYNPYTTAMNQVTNLETAAQQPLTTGINLGNLVSTAGARAGELGLRGAGQSVALATGAAATNSPLATALTGLGSSGLLTTGINTAIDAFSANQLDPSRPAGNRLYEPPPANLAPTSNITAPLPITYSGTSVYNS